MSSNFDNIRSAAIEYAETKELIDNLTKRKEQLEKIVKPVLADQGAVMFDGFVLDAVTVEGRKTLDTKALAAVYGDLSSFYKQGSPYIRMSVKRAAS